MGLLICGPLMITRGINLVGSGTDSLRARLQVLVSYHAWINKTDS